MMEFCFCDWITIFGKCKWMLTDVVKAPDQLIWVHAKRDGLWWVTLLGDPHKKGFRSSLEGEIWSLLLALKKAVMLETAYGHTARTCRWPLQAESRIQLTASKKTDISPITSRNWICQQSEWVWTEMFSYSSLQTRAQPIQHLDRSLLRPWHKDSIELSLDFSLQKLWDSNWVSF